MATTAADFNWAGTAVPGGDIGCINTSGSTITAGSVVIIDATNSLTTTGVTGFAAGLPAPGVTVSGTAGYAFGVAIETAVTLAPLRVRRIGIALCLATAAVITAGDRVKTANTGQVLTSASGTPTVGQALNTTAGNANDPVLVAIDIANNA
jgi:Uncharacterized conserved protein (DUF2190)